MTKILLEVLAEIGDVPRLIDRRFSREVGEVGAFSLRKVASVPSLVFRLFAAVCKAPSVCVFFCTNRPQSFLVDVVLGEVLRLFHVPTVNYIHTTGYSDLAARGRIWTALVRRLLSHAERSVCLGDSLVADIAPFIGQRPVSIIANTIEMPRNPRVNDRKDTRATGPVLFLSNLLEEKGADVFVDMAVKLCDEFPELTFALAGQPADQQLIDELQRRVLGAGHGTRVRFLGPKFGEEKWQLLSEARLLVFPSRYRFEAQPLTIVEAMSVGVPVIASNVGAIGEMITDENGVLLANPTVEEAVKAVSNFIHRPEWREKASRGAKRTYEAKYSREVFRSSWVDVLDATAPAK